MQNWQERLVFSLSALKTLNLARQLIGTGAEKAKFSQHLQQF